MATIDGDQLFTYEGRLASFKKTTAKKRGSTANGRGSSKALNWPHKQITPASLAKAGFFYNPSPESPDNVECFLCEKSLDGWETGDDPLIEHVKHAPQCGWAIVAAIDAEIEEYATQDPMQAEQMHARQATFGGRWPHEEKKGWQCKTKQLVESGWKYTPTAESDDMATCVYCHLALDGWEPSDKPYDEHYKRSPTCAFFSLGGLAQPTPKKKTRGKASRGSKASRLSTQSVQSFATCASDITGVADTTTDFDDTVLTTTSTMTQGKKGRGKKGAAGKAAKGGKKKTKKIDESVLEDVVDASTVEEVLSAPPPAKSTRGKKRGSDVVDDSALSTVEAPAPKRRATRQRGSAMTDTSVITNDTDMTEVPSTSKPPSRKKGRASSKTRKASATSKASAAALRATPDPIEFPDDDEIERQLEADLERQLTEDELAYEHKSALPKTDIKVSEDKPETNYAIFDPIPKGVSDAEVEDELQLLQQQMEIGDAAQLHVPKKGRKAGTRKASKQTKAKKPKSPTPPPPDEYSDEEPLVAAGEEEENISLGSTETVLKRSQSQRSSNASRGRTLVRKASISSQESVDMVTYVEPNVEPTSPEHQCQDVVEPPETTAIHQDAATVALEFQVAEDDDIRVAEDPIECSPVQIASELRPQQPLTPSRVISPAPSAKQAILSPSQSPQSSDAENQPPSSKPATSTRTQRIALAPITATPSRLSPSKRNMIGGLHSTMRWDVINFDAIFGTPRASADKENTVDRVLRHGKELTSPEKQMTVEEWIYFNAEEAEKKLKFECESMVSRFESEGSRAMRVLEGLVIE